MDQKSHYVPNQFFLKREEGVQHGGVKITAMTHLPRILTEESALTLAAELVKLAGGPVAFEPVLASAYGGRDKMHVVIEASLDAQHAAALKPAAPVAPPAPPVNESPAEFAARTGAPLVAVPKPAPPAAKPAPPAAVETKPDPAAPAAETK